FIKFDLSTLPSGTKGANVKKATLKLFVGSVSAIGSFDVQRVTGTWTEGTIKYSNTPGFASLGLLPVVLGTTDVNDYKTVDITDLVKAWLDSDCSIVSTFPTCAPNNGIALVPVATSGLNVALNSKENANTSHDPALEITLVTVGPTGPTGPSGPTGAQGLTG